MLRSELLGRQDTGCTAQQAQQQLAQAPRTHTSWCQVEPAARLTCATVLQEVARKAAEGTFDLLVIESTGKLLPLGFNEPSPPCRQTQPCRACICCVH